MDVLVQKFGGTSLSREEERACVCKKIVEAKKKYDGIVVVVSAMGRYGQAYATDTLLGLVNGDETYLTDREKDLLMSCGECISACVLVNDLVASGCSAVALTGGEAGVLTDSNFTKADIVSVNTNNIIKYLESGKVVVVTGFQGCNYKNEVTTLGRGGSDYTAVVLAEVLEAKQVDIFTDVDGIMTADPNICKDAKILEYISYEDAFQMADSGGKVLCKEAAEVARRSGVKLFIKNTFSERQGTAITWYNQIDNKSDNRCVMTIAHRKNRIQFLVEGPMSDREFFDALAKNNVSIDIINIFPERRLFTVDGQDKAKVLNVLKKVDVDYSYKENCCKVSVIGERMTGVPGIMARIVSVFEANQIELLQTADSLSTIACLISEESLELAVCKLHEAFELR